MNDIPDLENINISDYDSKKLCEIIVCNRYLGINKNLALQCMTELANRRINGDSFEFELFIEESFKELPVLNFKIPDLNSVLQVIGAFKK